MYHDGKRIYERELLQDDRKSFMKRMGFGMIFFLLRIAELNNLDLYDDKMSDAIYILNVSFND